MHDLYIVPLWRKSKSARKSVFPVNFEKQFSAIDSGEPGEFKLREYIIGKNSKTYLRSLRLRALVRVHDHRSVHVESIIADLDYHHAPEFPTWDVTLLF